MMTEHRRELATEPGPATQHIFDSGHEEAIASGASVIYEPAFIHDNVFIQVDLLKRNDDDTWDLIEVPTGC